MILNLPRSWYYIFYYLLALMLLIGDIKSPSSVLAAQNLCCI